MLRAFLRPTKQRIVRFFVLFIFVTLLYEIFINFTLLYGIFFASPSWNLLVFPSKNILIGEIIALSLSSVPIYVLTCTILAIEEKFKKKIFWKFLLTLVVLFVIFWVFLILKER